MEAMVPLYWTAVVLLFWAVISHFQKIGGDKCSGRNNGIPCVWWTPLKFPILEGVISFFQMKTRGIALLDDLITAFDTKIVKWPLGLKTVHLVWDADVIQKLLKSPLPEYLHKPQDIYHLFFPDYLKNGLLASSLDMWAPHRKAASHAFTFKTLGVYTQYINDCARDMVQKGRMEASNNVVDPETMNHLLDHFILKLLLQIIMGAEISAFSPAEVDTIHEQFRVVKDTVVARFLNPLLLFPPIWFFSLQRQKMNRAMAAGDELSNEIISRFKKGAASQSQNNNRKLDKVASTMSAEFTGRQDQERDNDEENNTPFQCFVEKLLIAGLSHKEIADEIATLVAAGHETNRIAMDMLLFQLALNPHHQQKCQEEVDEIFATKGGSDRGPSSRETLTANDLANMKYLERCILESFRLTPPVPLFGRLLQAPLEVSKDRVLQPGETVIVNPWSLHRHPEYYPKPDLFDPDRFLPENVKQRNPYTFIPFSLGNRNCLGWKVALTEMKVFTAWILRNFDLSTTDTPEDVNIYFDITIRLERPYNVSYKSRVI